MSLILDALKRAENERGAQAASGLPELSPVSLDKAPGNLRWLLIGIALAVSAGIGAWRYFAAAPSKPDSVAVAEQAKTALAAPIKPMPVPVPGLSQTQPKAQSAVTAKPIIGTEAVASFDEVTGPEDSPPPETPPAAAPAVAAAAPPVVSNPAPAVTAAPPQPAPLNKTPVRLRDTPVAYRSAFPALTIQVHSWDKEPAARFVRIDGYRYIEGEVLPAGPKLIEIIADGLILDWNGERVIFPLK